MFRKRHKSASVSKIQDRRVRRTRAHLGSAFAELLLLRSYDSIRVTDIARRADVGRATFYSHYDCKDDLLRAQLARVFGSHLVARPDEPWLFDCTALFAHLKQGRQIYRALMLGSARPAVLAITQDVLEEIVGDILSLSQSRQIKSEGMPASLLTRFVADALLGMVIWWEEQDVLQTPEETQAAFRILVGGAVRGQS